VDIAREIGCSAPMIRGGRYPNGVPDEWEPRSGCLGIGEREEILVGLQAGESLNAIARALGRSPSMVNISPSATPTGSSQNEIVASVGSRGDSYDNALAESFNGLYKWDSSTAKAPGGASTTSSSPP
jgi:hypothetical protein